ncbi:MAG: tRNA uridine-5-carboxymethylaminomethyl(34) synthesis GTPase MnmE [Candidatus Phocaeicola faecipullorum]|nr:tRNA uridine-5-carboxymethylaminomethyl(34) synthesis GTPase MnmE [Candidatus Phocaeicola faecipullorum]
MNDDTICAPATVPGTGAISVIRVSGGEALPVVSAMVKCVPGREIMMAPGYSVRFGRIFLDDGELLDEVLVTVFRAPHSYTGEDSAEISCHASQYIVDNVLHLLVEAGVRPAEPGEFTRRAYLNGKMDLAQAEAVADLIAAQGAAAHHLALSQLKGGFSNELKKMRGELLNIVSLMELELDFSEEDVEFADRSELKFLVEEVVAHISTLVSSFRLGNAIRNGIPVAIAGATNTGKSTLLNALLGEERAIVSDVHGTTRDTIEETLNVGGLLFRFIDTAGIRNTDEAVERIGIERTFRKVEEAVVVIVMLDAGRLCGADNVSFSHAGDGSTEDEACTAGNIPLQQTLEDVLGRIDPNSQKVIFVLNKMDLLGNTKMDLLGNTKVDFFGDVRGSSVSGDSVGRTGESLNTYSSPNERQVFSDKKCREVESKCPEKIEIPAEGLTQNWFRPGNDGQFCLFNSRNKNVIKINSFVSLINNQCITKKLMNSALVFMSARKGEGTDALKAALS